MPWWANMINGRVTQAATPPGNAADWTGPFPTRAAARSWLRSHPSASPMRSRMSRFTGALLARIALRYKGAGYVYGGNASSEGDWDCSSFISFVLHRAGLSLPGGRWGDPGFPPNSHGPVVVDYATWAGATTVGTPQAGDLCCWVGLGPDGHIGIAISEHEMISALNPSAGTEVTPIVGTGPSGVPLIYRRINGLAGGVVVTVAGQPQQSRPPVVVIAIAAAMYAGAMLLAAGALVGLAAGTRWAIREARQ